LDWNELVMEAYAGNIVKKILMSFEFKNKKKKQQQQKKKKKKKSRRMTLLSCQLHLALENTHC